MQALRQLIVGAVLVAAGPVAAAENCAGWRDPVAKKIVGGDRAKLAQWPSLAALRLTSPDRKESLFACGGTAIARDWVLTAAHCFDDIELGKTGGLVSSEESTKGWTLDIVLGTDDLAGVGEANVFPIAARVIHADYVRDGAPKHGNDIALVRLARSWPGAVAPLALDAKADPSVPPGAGLMVAGFGLTKGQPSGGTLQKHTRSDGSALLAGSRRLLHVGLPLVATPDCAARWSGRMVANGQLCAGFEGGTTRKDSCGGDSGGPLNVYDRRGCPTQVGLVSWGAADCGLPQTYGVYTRISAYADWLRRQVPGLAGATATASAASGSDLTAAEFVEQVATLVGGDKGQVRIAIKPIGPIKVDGKFAFDVTSRVAGRLIIIDVNAEGIATQIFPNEFVVDSAKSLIGAGASIAVPGPGYGFDHFRAEPPLGKGRLIALVVPADFPVQTLIAAPARTKGFKPERSATGYFMNLLQQIGAHIATSRASGATSAASAWAMTSVDYAIVP